MTTPTGFAVTYVRDGDPLPCWLTKRYAGHVMDVLVVFRTRKDAQAACREVNAQPGISGATVWTLEETQDAFDRDMEAALGFLHDAANATLAQAG